MRRTDYWPQLDGVRAVAIALVIAFHLGDLPGGWVGVDLFFVLSGYLITTKLLESHRDGDRLGKFWGRRARRLLPAVLALLVVLSVYSWAGGPGIVSAQLRAPALATLLYVANWQQIVAGHGYFAKYVAPGPLQHTWSLAIEEQFYLIWPLLLSAILWATRPGGAAKQRRQLLSVTVGLACLSAGWMAVAAHLFGSNRAYLGTDTRAWELLLGAAAAMLWPPGQASRHPQRWAVAGSVGLIGVAAGALTVGGPPKWVWYGGLVAVGLCATAFIVGSLRGPGGLVAKVLTLWPLRWIGVISYSLYLWHWPVIVLLSNDTTGLSGPTLLALRLATMLALSTCSYYLVELPLRGMDWPALGQRFHSPVVSFMSAGLIVVAILIVAGTVGPAGAPSGGIALASTDIAPPGVGGSPLEIPMAHPGHPYRVWLFGDSVMSDGSPGIQAALQSTGDVKVVANTTFGGWGLTTDPDWPADGDGTISQSHPQIVMGTWSWDDTEALQSPAKYLNRMESAMRAVLAPTTGIKLVVLIQFPQTGPVSRITSASKRATAWLEQTAAQDAWDRAAREAVDAFPGQALYLTTEQLFAPDASFYVWMKTSSGAWVRARKLDNTHFCPYGAAEFGALVTGELQPVLHLGAMKPGWEVGAWTRAARYNDPAGACPDDQPPAGYHGTPLPVLKRSG